MMHYLLDTHTFLWYINGSKELSLKGKTAIESPKALNYLSIVSFWEIAIKLSTGKLELNMTFAQLQDQIPINGFRLLPVTLPDTESVIFLPLHHRDPFDRMLIAQAQNNNLVLISKDAHFGDYVVKVLW